ncbi:hypothetical protein Tco_0015814 [Tanacetum coccineum]
MGDENPIRTLGDYSRPSHEGYRNTIELPDGNNVVPLRSDTIRLVQNRCSFHGLRSKDPNQHLKDFLKLVHSLDLDVANRERTRLRLFQFPFAIKLEIGLNVFPWDPSPIGRISLPVSLLNSFHREGLLNSNLALYDHEGWNDPRDFAKPVTAISLPQDTPKMPDRRLLELEDQISYLVKGSRMTPKTSSTHIPQAYSEAISSNPHSRNLDEPPRQNSFAFQKRARPEPQHQTLEPSFEARVQGYMVALTERMERFKKAIFKQREEINDRMAEMFGLLKELTTSRTPEKVLVREEARHPITKYVNAISLVKKEKEKNVENSEVVDKNVVEPSELDVVGPIELVDRKEGMGDGTNDESDESMKEELTE